MTSPDERRSRGRLGLWPRADRSSPRRMSREELEAEAATELERAASGEPPELARRGPPPPSSEMGMHRRYRFQFEDLPQGVEPADAP